MNALAAILTAVRLELDGTHVDRLRATVDVTLDGRDRFRATATLTHTGRILDLQSHSATAFHAGTTGDADLDRAVAAAIDATFVAASNAAVVVELNRRVRYRGRRAQ